MPSSFKIFEPLCLRSWLWSVGTPIIFPAFLHQSFNVLFWIHWVSVTWGVINTQPKSLILFSSLYFFNFLSNCSTSGEKYKSTTFCSFSRTSLHIRSSRSTCSHFKWDIAFTRAMVDNPNIIYVCSCMSPFSSSFSLNRLTWSTFKNVCLIIAIPCFGRSRNSVGDSLINFFLRRNL